MHLWQGFHYLSLFSAQYLIIQAILHSTLTLIKNFAHYKRVYHCNAHVSYYRALLITQL